jgi:hypothetical protein
MSAANRKRRPKPRTLLHHHLDRMRRCGGVPASPDGCACHPRAIARNGKRDMHWVAARDPRDGRLIWSWITLRAGVSLSPHDLTPDEVTHALEYWCVERDERKHSELPAGDDAHAQY